MVLYFQWDQSQLCISRSFSKQWDSFSLWFYFQNCILSLRWLKSLLYVYSSGTQYLLLPHSNGKLLHFVTGKLPFVTESLFRVIKIKVLSTPPHVYLKIRSDFSHNDSGENSIEVAGSHQKYMFWSTTIPFLDEEDQIQKSIIVFFKKTLVWI